MAELKDLLALRQRVEKLRSERDRARGALEQTMLRLKTEFKCSTLPAAEKLLKQYKAERADAAEAFDNAMAKFEKEWNQ